MSNAVLECKAVVPVCIEGPKTGKKSRRLTIVEVGGAFGVIDFKQVEGVSSPCTPAATGSSCLDMLRAAHARVQARATGGAKLVMLQSQVLAHPPHASKLCVLLPQPHSNTHTTCLRE